MPAGIIFIFLTLFPLKTENKTTTSLTGPVLWNYVLNLATNCKSWYFSKKNADIRNTLGGWYIHKKVKEVKYSSFSLSAKSLVIVKLITVSFKFTSLNQERGIRNVQKKTWNHFRIYNQRAIQVIKDMNIKLHHFTFL